MQEEVTQKTVTFCIRATKITADLLKKVLVAYLRHQKQKSVEKKAQKNQPKQGKVTVKELAKQNVLENAPEVGCATYRSRIYKIPMVRMFTSSGKLTKSANVRVYKKTI